MRRVAGRPGYDSHRADRRSAHKAILSLSQALLILLGQFLAGVLAWLLFKAPDASNRSVVMLVVVVAVYLVLTMGIVAGIYWKSFRALRSGS